MVGPVFKQVSLPNLIPRTVISERDYCHLRCCLQSSNSPRFGDLLRRCSAIPATIGRYRKGEDLRKGDERGDPTWLHSRVEASQRERELSCIADIRKVGATKGEGIKTKKGTSSSAFSILIESSGLMVFAYFDETGMHASAPDTVVAGYLFEKNKAKEFRRKLEEKVFPLLPPNRKGKRVFHASKCCALFGNGEYESLRYEDRQKIAHLIADAATETVMLGCVVGMVKN